MNRPVVLSGKRVQLPGVVVLNIVLAGTLFAQGWPGHIPYPEDVAHEFSPLVTINGSGTLADPARLVFELDPKNRITYRVFRESSWDVVAGQSEKVIDAAGYVRTGYKKIEGIWYPTRYSGKLSKKLLDYGLKPDGSRSGVDHETFKQYTIEEKDLPNGPQGAVDPVQQDLLEGEIFVDLSGDGFGSGHSQEIAASEPSKQQPQKAHKKLQFNLDFSFNTDQDTWTLSRKYQSFSNTLFQWTSFGDFSEHTYVAYLPPFLDGLGVYCPDFGVTCICDLVCGIYQWIQSDWQVDFTLYGEMIA